MNVDIIRYQCCTSCKCLVTNKNASVYPVMGKAPGYCNSKLLAVFVRAMKVGNS